MKLSLYPLVGLRLVGLCVLVTGLELTTRGAQEPANSGPQLLSTNGGKPSGAYYNRHDLEVAAKNGDAKAKADLGEILLRGDGSGSALDVAGGLKLLDEAARAGQAAAAFRVGMTLLDEDLMAKAEPERALAYLRAAAAGGYPEAFHNVGVAYSTGRGTKKDYPEALAWFILAGKRKTGGTVEQDLRRYLKSVRRLEYIDAGERRAPLLEKELAQTTVAKMLPPAAPFNVKGQPAAATPSGGSAVGGGVKIGAVSVRDEAPSLTPPALPVPGISPTTPGAATEPSAGPFVKLYGPTGKLFYYSSVADVEREAAQGKADALAVLGQVLAEGKLVPADAKRAAEVLARGAKAGSADAAQTLADLYTKGRIDKDDTQAYIYTLQAAKGGVLTATFNLGAMYANGRGTPVNYAEALTWMTVAKYFNRDPGSLAQIRDYLKKTNPDQIAPAEKRAQAHIAAIEKVRRDMGF